MTLVEIARIYTELVHLHDRVPEGEPVAREEVGVLRTKYHELLMEKMTDEGIHFSDRFEAMHMAFEMAKSGSQKGISRQSLNEPRPQGY